jgi:hypothetical protein
MYYSLNKYVILQNTVNADTMYLVLSVDESLVKHVLILCYNMISEHATKFNILLTVHHGTSV